MNTNKLYAKKDAVTVTYGKNDYRIQNDRGYRHIVVYEGGVRKKIKVHEAVGDWCFDYIFGGLFQSYPCPAIEYFIYRHRMGRKISTVDYAIKFKVHGKEKKIY